MCVCVYVCVCVCISTESPSLPPSPSLSPSSSLPLSLPPSLPPSPSPPLPAAIVVATGAMEVVVMGRRGVGATHVVVEVGGAPDGGVGEALEAPATVLVPVPGALARGLPLVSI